MAYNDYKVLKRSTVLTKKNRYVILICIDCMNVEDKGYE